ncbi:MAG TPA: protein kinase, partial [Vicinamibacterales bacterium]
RERLNVALAGRYALEQELGRGGMATVYAATDLKHGRRVAIKVLNSDRSAAISPERFTREIAIAANLSHPHIVPVFDSGNVADVLFYVMPCVTGESLRQKLQRERQLSVDDALRIARHMAAALGYAHRQGVIHRDIKPENVLLHEGEALVADFGIAVPLADTGMARLTQIGLVIGTPAYMSPEQARGETLDERSDLYSLACVVYEMLAGEPPSAGRTIEAFMAKRAVPKTIGRALQRALAGVPRDRFVNVTDFAEALVASDREESTRKSVAVLPFINMSADPENEYLSDGITEDVIAQLAKIRSLKVISRTSVMRFKNRTSPLADIARDLGVRTLLEGSVRRIRDRIRVVAQLIDAEADEHLWAERYDRDLTDIFAIQAEVAEKIAGALRAELSPTERAHLLGPRTHDIEAYNLTLLGRFYTNKWSTADWHKGVAHLEQAIARDPRYAEPHAVLAINYASGAYLNVLSPKQAFAKAEEEARIALALNDADSDGHVALALVAYYFHWEWDTARRELERALELSPGNAVARDVYGSLLDTLCRHDEAMRAYREGHQLNPLDAGAVFNLAYGHLMGRECQDAVRQFQRALDLAPASSTGIYGLGTAQLVGGDPAAASRTFERAVEQGGGDTAMLGYLGWAYGVSGRQEDAERTLNTLVKAGEESYVSSYHVAMVCLGLGRYDEMFSWLERAYAERSTWMVWFHITPAFDPVRQDHRFQDLISRMRLPAERFSAAADVTTQSSTSGDR